MRKTLLRLVSIGLIFLAPLISSTSGNPVWSSAAWDARPPNAVEMEALRVKLAKENTLGHADLFSMAAAEATFVSHGRPETEWMAWELAHLYKQDGIIDYANRAEQILMGLAARPIPEPPEGIHIEGKWLPYPAIIAFGILKEKGYWSEHSPSDDDYKILEQWLRNYGASFVRLIQRPDQVTNYTPFGLKHIAVLGLILDNFDYLNLAYETAERLAYSPEFWHADHIWQEGNVSYARQVSGNLKAMLPALWEGYSLGKVCYSTAQLDKLSARLQEIDEAQARFSMPSGRAIPVNDTHWGISPEAIPRLPRSIEFPDFGHFALPGSDIESHLSIPLLTGGGRYGGGHYHDSMLSLQLWAHGQELLPDAGYPFRPENHRYFHMSPYAHNMPTVEWDDVTFPQKGEWGVWSGSWARSSLIGYESGESSGRQVSYILARTLGPETLPESRIERMLIQVSTGTWSGYLIDVSWVQGGDRHLNFIRQTEDEAVEQTVQTVLTPDGRTLAEVLGNEEAIDYKNWGKYIKNPKRVQATEGFTISWKGTETGVILKAHLAPEEGSDSWISEMPRLRPTKQNPKLRDAFPGYHLTRRRTVTDQSKTIWAAVYEPVQADEAAKIKKVNWERSGDGLSLEVVFKNRNDRWIVGTSKQSTEVGEFRLEGRAAGFSFLEDIMDWKWASLGSSLTNGNEPVIAAPESKSVDVLSLHRATDGWELVVAGPMTLPASGWALLEFADGSGRAVELTRVIKTNEKLTTFSMEKDPGLQIDGSAVQRTQFPLKKIRGATSIRPLGAFFVDTGNNQPVTR